MFRSGKRITSKSQTGFILINGTTKQQQPLRWQWLTQRNINRPLINEDKISHYPKHSYSEKKSILTNLQQKPRIFSSFQIKQGFSLKQTVKRGTTSSLTTRLQNKPKLPFTYVNSNDEQISIPSINFGIDEAQMYRNIKTAKQNSTQLLIIISVKRIGLRFKINHTFSQYCPCKRPSHNHDLKEISSKIKIKMKQFSRIDKQIYYFKLDLEPIHHYHDLHSNRIIFADISPKLHFNQELYEKIINQISKLQNVLDKYDNEFSINKNDTLDLQNQGNQDQPIHDWQMIKNVKQYVAKLLEDPWNHKIQNIERPKDELLEWYDQKFTSQKVSIQATKQNDKNLLFQSKSHYPKEMKNQRLLQLARQKIQTLPTTNNRHKYIPKKIDLMMEFIKRQQQSYNNGIQAQTKNMNFQPSLSKKDMLFYLDKKNSLLTTQNIPYLIEKYGMNRFQIYNLYNLYKSFEKISLMRKTTKQHMQNVMKKGIDRQTFQVGLKGLDMIPGDQLIKNICNFGDFISWEHFIKIISISLRKTPEQKLTAILKGISSSQNEGFLSRHQISVMIGNSLHKLFDRQQTQLKQYFTTMAMKQFDKQNNGKISISILKQKILQKGSQNLNMVSFLILNT